MLNLSRTFGAVLALSIGTCASAGGHVEDAPEFEWPEGWFIGVGVVGGNGIYVGEEASALAVPVVQYESDAFSFGLDEGLRATLWENDDFRISGILAPRFSDIGASNAPELAGLDREELTVDAGVLLDYGLAPGTDLSFSVSTDITGGYGGSQIDLGVEQVVPLGRLPVFIGAGVTWQDNALASYLYGVNADEVIPGRAAYDPGSVLVPYLSIGAAVPITDDVALFGAVSAEFLPSEITNSPLIDENKSFGAIVALTYNF